MIVALFKATVDHPEFRLRLVAKFCENEFEKMERLFEIRFATSKKLESLETELAEELGQLKEDGLNADELNEIETDHYLKRLDIGLFSLQLVDQLLLFLWNDPITTDVELPFLLTYLS